MCVRETDAIIGKAPRLGIHTLLWKRAYSKKWGMLRVGLSPISSQVQVSDLGEWRHFCHLFRWEKMWRVTFVTFLGRTWRSRTRKHFFELVTFFVTSFPKNVTFWPRRYKFFWNGRNVTIRLGLKHIFLFPSQICHLSRKREAGRPFRLRPTLTWLREENGWESLVSSFIRKYSPVGNHVTKPRIV